MNTRTVKKELSESFFKDVDCKSNKKHAKGCQAPRKNPQYAVMQ